MKQKASFHIYRNVIIERCALNASGMRWTARTARGIVRADTLAGIKRLIAESIQPSE